MRRLKAKQFFCALLSAFNLIALTFPAEYQFTKPLYLFLH